MKATNRSQWPRGVGARRGCVKRNRTFIQTSVCFISVRRGPDGSIDQTEAPLLAGLRAKSNHFAS